MKRKYSIILMSSLVLLACSKVVEPGQDMRDAVELTGIEAEVYGSLSKAPALDKNNHVGRSIFVNKDQMELTCIKRSDIPIKGFSYMGIVYDHEVDPGQSSGGWNRDESKGSTEASSTQIPERIYWSDAANPHTFIGFSKPQDTGFDWKNEGAVYYGSLGNPMVEGEIDHTDSTKIVNDDLLLTYNTNKVAETGGSVAKIYFSHALAMARVIVNIADFSPSSDSPDARSIVSDMVLKNMPTMYRWTQTSDAVEALTDEDRSAVSSFYGIDCYNQKKDIRMWIPRPEGSGSGVGRQFIFYALAVPGIMAENDLKMNFYVAYQDPMDPWEDAEQTVPNMKVRSYSATMLQSVEFRAGHCTTINVSLNHVDEEVTVGAEYMDWQYVDSPSSGELKKNPTMLTKDMLKRENYTLLGDRLANKDDATWLYVDQTSGKIVDVNGNDGSSKDTPFVISNARELVSFANEVKGNARENAVNFKNLAGRDSTITNGFDFKGYYIKIDANLTMQPKLNIAEADRVEWPGIGRDDPEHEFNGILMGRGRTIRNLNGKPFIFRIGQYGMVEKLDFSDILEIDGNGLIAHINKGYICGVYANGLIRQARPVNTYSGTIVGINETTGCIVSSAHVGDIEAYASGDGTIGGFVGYNKGVILSCYHSGKEHNLSPEGQHYHTYAGVGAYEKESSFACSCYFNTDIDPDKSDYAELFHGKLFYGVYTEIMQSERFVSGTEEIIERSELKPVTGSSAPSDWWERHYSLNQGLDMFRKRLDDYFMMPPAEQAKQDIPEVVLKSVHMNWFKEHVENYYFAYIPGSYPKTH